MNKETLILPQELLIQILLRLPVKSLVRFRCVSKSWLSLISDPHFEISHFELTARPTQKLVLLPIDASEIRIIDFNDFATAVVKLNIPLLPPRVKILGSCRGFILLDCYPHLYLWNPCTGVHRKLPLSIIYSSLGGQFSPILQGFGYDPSTDDYLVTIASYDPRKVNMIIRIEFFSLRANTWKELEGPRLHYRDLFEAYDHRVGLHFNAALHWFARRRYNRRSLNVIIVYDLIERSFSEIAMPNDFHGDPDFIELRVLGGLLSVCAAGCIQIAGGIWIMREYKVQSSWFKSHTVVSAENIRNQYLSPICYTESGDIVGFDGGAALVKFNDRGEVQEYRSYCDHSRGHEVAMYTESLLSLPGNSQQDRTIQL